MDRLPAERPALVQGGFRSFLLLPLAASPAAVGLIWRYMYHADFGVINFFVSSVGLKEQNWLGDINLAMPSVMLFDIWQWTPFVAIIVLAGLHPCRGSFRSRRTGRAPAVDGAATVDLPDAYAGHHPGLRPAQHRRHPSLRSHRHADAGRSRNDDQRPSPTTFTASA